MVGDNRQGHHTQRRSNLSGDYRRRSARWQTTWEVAARGIYGLNRADRFAGSAQPLWFFCSTFLNELHEHILE
jgi:hypothetical protein